MSRNASCNTLTTAKSPLPKFQPRFGRFVHLAPYRVMHCFKFFNSKGSEQETTQAVTTFTTRIKVPIRAKAPYDHQRYKKEGSQKEIRRVISSAPLLALMIWDGITFLKSTSGADEFINILAQMRVKSKLGSFLN